MRKPPARWLPAAAGRVPCQCASRRVVARSDECVWSPGHAQGTATQWNPQELGAIPGTRWRSVMCGGPLQHPGTSAAAGQRREPVPADVGRLEPVVVTVLVAPVDPTDRHDLTGRKTLLWINHADEVPGSESTRTA